jgi:hypothetical protein
LQGAADASCDYTHFDPADDSVGALNPMTHRDFVTTQAAYNAADKQITPTLM